MIFPRLIHVYKQPRPECQVPMACMPAHFIAPAAVTFAARGGIISLDAWR